MSKLDKFESGKQAPSMITRDYNSIYIHITPKGPVKYIQSRYPSGNFWEEESNVGPTPPGGIEYLGQLLDVTIPAPNTGEALAYNMSGTGEWGSLEMSPRGNTLIVSTRGFTTAVGAAREKSTLHFSSLTEAQNAAQVGDMIVVYPGVYTNPNNLWIPGVNYFFMPGATVTRTFGQMLNSIAGGECNIYGYGSFISTAFVGDNWDFQGVDSKCVIQANVIRVYTNTGLIFRNNADVTIDANEIIMTYRQYLIYWRIFSGRCHIRANKIIMENGAGVGTARIFTQREIAAEADIRVECPFMETQSDQSFVNGIFGIELTSPGVPKYYGDFYDNRTGVLTDATIYQRTSYYHEGNIYVNPEVRAIHIDFSIPKVCTMVGNIYGSNNTNNKPAITTGSSNGELHFKGEIHWANTQTIVLGGSNWKTFFDGAIFNSHDNLEVVAGIVNNSATHDLVILYSRIIFENGPLQPLSFSLTGTNNDIRLYGDKLLSNTLHDPLTTDLLSGSTPLNWPNVI